MSLKCYVRAFAACAVALLAAVAAPHARAQDVRFEIPRAVADKLIANFFAREAARGRH